MQDDEFLHFLDDYLEPPAEANPDMAEIRIVWERDNPNFGSRHIWEKHRITESEVEQVIFEVPPYVEASTRSTRIGPSFGAPRAATAGLL